MHIKDVKTAIKIGDFVLRKNHNKKVLTDDSARICLIVQNGIIKKIAGSA